jgi:hypothetical protein
VFVQSAARYSCLTLLSIATGVTFTACSTPPNGPATEKAPEKLTLASLAKLTAGQFQPVPLPDPHIAGYKFPEAEDTIVGWTKDNNHRAMDLHAWGIWTALTQDSDQVFNGQKLRVFETWYDPDDLASTATPLTAAGQRIRSPRRLQAPRQFQHGAANQALLNAAGPHGQSTILAFVKYDPSASDFIVNKNLLSKAQLNTYLNTDHDSAVPAFPSTAIALKPVYTPLPTNQLIDGRYFLLMAWPGPPQLTYNQAQQLWNSQPFPQSAWAQCIWIDIQGKGNSGAGVDKTCAADGSSRTSANTYGVDQFIHYQMTKAEADSANSAARSVQPSSTAAFSAGDFAVLTAMHVTSREMTRWTWQTFWWTNVPDNPAAPSAASIAAGRPPQLTGVARHYAQCTAYEEVMPPQPNSGGSNTGESVYCYNPYLEAPFSPAVLPNSIPGMTVRNKQAVKTANNVGVQTNCMSCHETAKFPPDPLPYTGDRYVDIDDPMFKGFLKVDFLWSIADLAK